jgi:hypothetical protein
MDNSFSREEALERARSASREDILEELRKQGVNDLGDLVDVQLQNLRDRQSDVEGYMMDNGGSACLIIDTYVMCRIVLD